MYIAERDGAHMVDGVNMQVMLIPSAARRSTLGVLTTSFPLYPRSHQERSSAMYITIFGFSGNGCEQEQRISGIIVNRMEKSGL